MADRTQDAGGVATACNPFDASPDTIRLDERSFDTAGKPLITFTSGDVTSTAGGLHLVAGPSLFSVSIPVTADIILTLKITGPTIEADVAMEGDRVVAMNGRLGGVIDARTADTLRGLAVEEIGLTPENSLLDAIFANGGDLPATVQGAIERSAGHLLALDAMLAPLLPGKSPAKPPDLGAGKPSHRLSDCVGLDALWQLCGFFLSWSGCKGRGRALGAGAVKFTGQILPTARKVM